MPSATPKFSPPPAKGIEQLNARYPGNRFLLFHRPRVWSESERRWIGRERKRGKLEDLNDFLCGEGDPAILCAGELPRPIPLRHHARRRYPTPARHRPPHDRNHSAPAESRGPRPRHARPHSRLSRSSSPASASRCPARPPPISRASSPIPPAPIPIARPSPTPNKISSAKPSSTAKPSTTCALSATSVGNRFPPETLLSHDLIEGAYVGVGLASDIELFENMPFDYATYSKRQHRWIRGDWQIAPWILSRVPTAQGALERNPLSVINRWRIFDNLRRSLVPSASLLLLLFGWLTSKAPAVWSLVVGLAIAIPAVAPLFERFARYSARLHPRLARRFRRTHPRRRDDRFPAPPSLACRSTPSYRVTYRRWFSRHHLLEWQTAESASLAHSHFTSTMRQMLMVSGFSIVLMIVMRIQSVFAPTSVFLILWALSPLLMQWLARPVRSHSRQRFQRANSAFLRTLARRTWRFFDDLVGPAMNWLPPDNTQLSLHIEVAPRTSPTNIGFWLTSALAARDFGYLTADDFCRRCTANPRHPRPPGTLRRPHSQLVRHPNPKTIRAPLCFDSRQRQSARLPVGARTRLPGRRPRPCPRPAMHARTHRYPIDPPRILRPRHSRRRPPRHFAAPLTRQSRRLRLDRPPAPGHRPAPAIA